MILVDTNVIVALADRSDTAHELCRRWLEEQTYELALPITVLAEACYLIDRSVVRTPRHSFSTRMAVSPHADSAR